MTDRIRQQLVVLMQTWKQYALPVGTFRGYSDDFERGYRSGFSKALNKCADELSQLLACYGEEDAEE